MNRILPRLILPLWLLLPIASKAGTVEGALVLDQAKPHPTAPGYKPQTKEPVQPPDRFGAVVYLENNTGAYPRRAGDLVTIEQKGYQFRPAISAVQTGGRILFPNMDGEFHNVFSYSKAKRFDLGRFRKEDDSPAVTFDKAGVVKVYCEIHQHMRCVVLILDTPWFVTTDQKGHFMLRDVPAGDYTLKAFLPSERTVEMPVTVPGNGTVQVEFKR